MIKPKARNATPPSDNPNEYCECSRCGNIFRIADHPKTCPGCWKRRTYKDIVFPDNPFKKNP